MSGVDPQMPARQGGTAPSRGPPPGARDVCGEVVAGAGARHEDDGPRGGMGVPQQRELEDVLDETHDIEAPEGAGDGVRLDEDRAGRVGAVDHDAGAARQDYR
ncbi:hypothetical protein MOPEL_134_00140 [Mobilicoccus pelagius NBRC 104925]|uniref:Uncharacterized protein n=1 Tax=Mobilicoccus pelagius NBRC 104925 TaxID=1089455 RepID=H5UVH2_9MICO|nr:hypothetical protein MOPEL_134_00140 [Mobilicoccus pelagius NBRC 104925]